MTVVMFFSSQAGSKLTNVYIQCNSIYLEYIAHREKKQSSQKHNSEMVFHADKAPKATEPPPNGYLSFDIAGKTSTSCLKGHAQEPSTFIRKTKKSITMSCRALSIVIRIRPLLYINTKVFSLALHLPI